MKASKYLVAFLISVTTLSAGCSTAARPEPVPLKKPEVVKDVTVQEAKKEVPAVAEIVKTKPAIENKTEVKPVPKPIAVAQIKPIPPTIKPVVSKPNPKPVTKPIAVVSNANNKPVAILVKNEDLKPVVIAPTKSNASLPALPPNAIALIPVLRKYLDMLWPKVPARSYVASKIEQETCISLKHKGCWSSHTELKTKREYGFGLGQITVAYKSDGSERFNVWKDLIKIDPVLKEKWTWENRYDSELQIRALIVKSKMSVDSIRFDTANPTEHLAFGLVTYNSGSVLIDRRLCMDIKGCDPSKWYNNVELYSSKSKVAQKGYGKSFFEISRDYPRNIMFVRRPKYIPYLDN